MQREIWDKKVEEFLTEVDLRCKIGVLESIIIKHTSTAQTVTPRTPEYKTRRVEPRLLAILTTGLEHGSVTTTFLDQYVAYLSAMIWFVSPIDAAFVAQRLRRDMDEIKDELYLAATGDGIHG
jgi:hypothetical protein